MIRPMHAGVTKRGRKSKNPVIHALCYTGPRPDPDVDYFTWCGRAAYKVRGRVHPDKLLKSKKYCKECLQYMRLYADRPPPPKHGSSWEKLPVAQEYRACNVCPPKGATLPMDAVLAVGFGAVTVTKGRQRCWSGDDEEMTLAKIEELAKVEPNNDWRVKFDGAMRQLTYQRHGNDEWVLIHSGVGFA